MTGLLWDARGRYNSMTALLWYSMCDLSYFVLDISFNPLLQAVTRKANELRPTTRGVEDWPPVASVDLSCDPAFPALAAKAHVARAVKFVRTRLARFDWKYVGHEVESEFACAAAFRWEHAHPMSGTRSKSPKRIPVPSTSHSNPTHDPVLVAAVLRAQHPDWSVQEIAKAAGCSRSTLYDSPWFRRVHDAMQEHLNDLPRGTKEKDGDMEAWRSEDRL
jgi:hypothetical protein